MKWFCHTSRVKGLAVACTNLAMSGNGSVIKKTHTVSKRITPLTPI